MANDGSLLLAKHELVKLSVRSSTQISSRTAAIRSRLTAEHQPSEKPVVVSLTARAAVASKLISIVEIAKRDLVSKGVKIYQYNALTSEMLDIAREPKKKATGSDGPVKEGAENDDSDDAFETMGAPTDATKRRDAPVMTIYLSTMPVKELKAAYGYV